MIACVLSYDGWVAVSFIAGEIRNPKRNLLLALVLGLGTVIVVYVLANVAYLRVLSIPEIAAADRVGALVAERTMGHAGGAFLAAVILISITGSMNGWTMTAPRIFFAQARDGMFLPIFGRIHPRYRTPHISIALFGAWSVLLTLTGTYETLASYAMYAAWIFYGLTSAGVIVLRMRRPDLARPYRMWGYPATLLLFLAVAIGFVLNTLIATPGPAIAGTLLIAAGAPVYWIWGRAKTIPVFARKVNERLAFFHGCRSHLANEDIVIAGADAPHGGAFDLRQRVIEQRHAGFSYCATPANRNGCPCGAAKRSESAR